MGNFGHVYSIASDKWHQFLSIYRVNCHKKNNINFVCGGLSFLFTRFGSQSGRFHNRKTGNPVPHLSIKYSRLCCIIWWIDHLGLCFSFDLLLYSMFPQYGNLKWYSGGRKFYNTWWIFSASLSQNNILIVFCCCVFGQN